MKLASFGQSQWTRRWIFVSANALAIVLVYFVLVDPIRGMLNEREEDLAQRRMTLARYKAVSAQEEAVRAFAKQIAEGNARGELIAGSNSGIVDANLQARLKSLAEQVSVVVRSIQKLPPKNLRGVELVGARIDVSAPIGPLQALTRALEGETPLLLITSATLRGQASIWNMMNGDAAGATEQSLEAQFDVYGGALTENHP